MNEQAAVDRNENERSEWHEHKHYTHRPYMHIRYTDSTHARANEKCIQVRKTIQLQWLCVCVCCGMQPFEAMCSSMMTRGKTH